MILSAIPCMLCVFPDTMLMIYPSLKHQLRWNEQLDSPPLDAAVTLLLMPVFIFLFIV